MKIVLTGGTGFLGSALAESLAADNHDVVALSRSAGGTYKGVRHLPTPGGYSEIDGADAVINLAGRSVNCRYTEENLAAMRSSRVDSTRVIGAAIERAARPPKVWLQMSTATIYSHRFEAANDEETGLIGGSEPGAPAQWRRSVELAQAWEAAQEEARTPGTRKVLLRTALVLSEDRGGVFDVLSGLVKKGLGGPIAGGAQYVSWLHRRDLERALALLLERSDLEGPVNLASPNPLPQREFMAGLRAALGVRFGLPATGWMAALGAWMMGTAPELVLKSRRVAPARLLRAGFTFDYPTLPAAAQDLVKRAQHRW